MRMSIFYLGFGELEGILRKNDYLDKNLKICWILLNLKRKDYIHPADEILESLMIYS
jgi:hypothetical protein